MPDEEIPDEHREFLERGREHSEPVPQDSNEFVEVSDTYHLEFGNLPPSWHVLGYTVQMKALDEDGNVVLVNMRSPETPLWEGIGFTQQANAHYLAQIMGQ